MDPAEAPPADVLVNAIVDGRVLRLFGRSGTYEVEPRDGFYLPVADVERLPRAWQSFVSAADRGCAWVSWPEPARAGHKKRLEHFTEKVFAKAKLAPLEADVSPVERYLAEHPRVAFARDWRLLWIDVETTRVSDWSRPWENNRILSFSWASGMNGSRGHVRLQALHDDAERALLGVLFRLLVRHDVALAWNGKDFDFAVIQGRAKALDVEHDERLTHWLDALKIFKRYFTKSEDGAVKQSFKLDAIGSVLLGEHKVPLEQRAAAMGWDRAKDKDPILWCWRNAPELLREYNDQDVHLMRRIEEKTGFVALHLEVCRTCHVLPTERTIFPMTLIDGRMLRVGHDRGYRFPTRMIGGEHKREIGAFVPPAVPGLHDSVAMLDFARMYPSIILAANLSPETLDPDGDVRVPKTDSQGRLQAGLVARFRSQPEGHLPFAIRAILEARKRYAKQKEAAETQSPEWYDADRLSTALKVLANTFYGVLLSPLSRYYSRELGGSITSIGRLLLATTIGEAQARGHRVLFGDTDSVAFGPATDADAEALRDRMNREVVPALVRGFGGQPEGTIRVEYEKRFGRVVVLGKKRYAGRFAVYGGKAVEGRKLAVTGLEMVRSDVCTAARTLQAAFVEPLIAGTPADELWRALRKTRDAFEAGETPVPDLILRRGLSKPIAAYATKAVHVRVAEAMQERGLEVGEGTKIQFLVTRDGALIPEDLQDPTRLDLQVYWNKHVYPATQRVLEAAYPALAWEGFLFERGHQRGQVSLFVDSPRPAAPVKSECGRRVFRAVRLEIDACDVDAPRLQRLLTGWPGPHPVRLEVVDRSTRTELALPQRIPDPAADPAFLAALAAVRVRAMPRTQAVQLELTARGK
jgi:DNA polymerase elongation subunit (family B)